MSASDDEVVGVERDPRDAERRNETVYAAAVIWVAVFGGIALIGLVLLICYVVWLVHKAADVMSEVAVLADRADQLTTLLSQIQSPPSGAASNRWQSDLIVAEEL